MVFKYSIIHFLSRYIKQLNILNELGHHKSIVERNPIDFNGDPLPWFTYPSIEYLNQLDLSDLNVFEWGSGNSSLYFSKRVKSIISVESDYKWFQKVDLTKNMNQSILFKENEVNYIKSIKELECKYDIIIIDGICRNECVQISIDFLNDGGFIIFDNSDRHPEACKWLREQDLIEIDFHGFGPINTYTWTTSFFCKRDFKLSPISFQPRLSKGGLQ